VAGLGEAGAALAGGSTTGSCPPSGLSPHPPNFAAQAWGSGYLGRLAPERRRGPAAALAALEAVRLKPSAHATVQRPPIENHRALRAGDSWTYARALGRPASSGPMPRRETDRTRNASSTWPPPELKQRLTEFLKRLMRNPALHLFAQAGGPPNRVTLSVAGWLRPGEP